MVQGHGRGSPRVGRRSFLRAGAALTAGALGYRCGSNGGSRRLRVMLNGGIYEELARRLVVEPFERDTGTAWTWCPDRLRRS